MQFGSWFSTFRHSSAFGSVQFGIWFGTVWYSSAFCLAQFGVIQHLVRQSLAFDSAQFGAVRRSLAVQLKFRNCWTAPKQMPNCAQLPNYADHLKAQLPNCANHLKTHCRPSTTTQKLKLRQPPKNPTAEFLWLRKTSTALKINCQIVLTTLKLHLTCISLL